MILSDGEQNTGFGGSAGAIADAQALKDAGIIVFAVGFGTVQQSTLNGIASTPSSRYAYLGGDIAAIQVERRERSGGGETRLGGCRGVRGRGRGGIVRSGEDEGRHHP